LKYSISLFVLCIRYKESLLGAAAHGDLGDTSDPRRLIVTEFRVIFDPSEGRPGNASCALLSHMCITLHDEIFNFSDIVHCLDGPERIAALKKSGISMKEGCKYKFRISFRVQHDILPGIKFVNTVKKMVFSDKEEVVIGSYAPASVPHVFEFPRYDYNEAPKGKATFFLYLYMFIYMKKYQSI